MANSFKKTKDGIGDEIVEGVYVSDLDTVRANSEKIDEKVDTVISVCQDKCEYESAQGIHIPIAETAGQERTVGGEMSFNRFCEAVSAIQTKLESGQDILVHCHAGVNRSVGTLSCALGEYLDMQSTRMLSAIKSERRRANPTRRTRAWMEAYDNGLHESEKARESVDDVIATAQQTVDRKARGSDRTAGIYGYDPSGIDKGQSVDQIKEELEEKRSVIGESN